MIQIQSKQSRQLRENAVLISEMNSQIVELKRRVEEADAKNREIMAKITQIHVGEPNPGGGGGGGGGGGNSANVNVNTGVGVGVINTSGVVVLGGTSNTNCSSSSNISIISNNLKCLPNERTSTPSSTAASTTRNIKPRITSVMLKRRLNNESSSLSSLSPPSLLSSISSPSPLCIGTVSNEIGADVLKDISKKPKLES